jgi:hypothetical protein
MGLGLQFAAGRCIFMVALQFVCVFRFQSVINIESFFWVLSFEGVDKRQWYAWEVFAWSVAVGV